MERMAEALPGGGKKISHRGVPEYFFILPDPSTSSGQALRQAEGRP
jgi:hypothetical protein